ncbi:hypothetical protein FB45DRAFT_1051179 [Roridomyces roridus]|uniref:Uncharacterized protein n=1 Tax=Roridomyces roridus TaxID=1738132 RepID=A0AAD7FZM9_9AGAR|nr:hypothetical protein FB45DRAFT_1051179 [Roridomyces roridus]
MCRALHLPAVSVLWDQTSLIPLLKCLPPGIWKPPADDLEQTLETPKTRVQFRWVPQPSDWTRPFFYAGHVKSLVEDGKLPTHLTSVVYAYLSFALSDSSPLFPNLRRITWRTDDALFAFLRILFGDKDAVYRTRHAGIPAFAVFEPLAKGILAFGPTFSGTVNAAICSWGQLEVLGWSILDSASLRHLARLPSLRVLRLQSLPTQALLEEIDTGGTRPCFSALRELHARAEALEDLAGPILTEDWEALTTSLACISSNTLTHLSLTEEFTLEDSTPGGIESLVKAEHLRPLLSFAALEELTFISGVAVDLDNAFVAKMAMAWPYLRKLDISPVYQPPTYKPRVTTAGLLPLAQHCLSLTTLGLPFDASEAETADNKKPGGGIVSLSLTHLYVTAARAQEH